MQSTDSIKTKNIHLGYVIFLSVVAALGGLLYGYDTAVISGTVAQVTRQFDLNVMQQGWYVGCALVGSIGGVAVAGLLSDRLGRKPTLFISAVLFTSSAVGCCFCGSLSTLVFWRIVGGVGIGIVSIVAPVYISEIAVTRYRGRLVELFQLAITVGFLLAYLANYLLLHAAQTVTFHAAWLQWVVANETWRSMLGMETLPAALFFVVIFMLPESPRWLIVQQREDRAKHILSRIYRLPADVQTQVEATRASLLGQPKAHWRELLQPGILRAVIIGMCIAILGQFMGVNAVLYYGPTFFAEAGFSDPLFCQVLVGLVNMLTTVLAMSIIDRIGRKRLIYIGVTSMIVCLLCISFYFLYAGQLHLSVYFMLVFFLLYVFSQAFSISAVVNVILSEMYPNSVRGLAMSCAGFTLWIGTYLIGQLTPWMLQTLTPAGTFMLFAVMCVPYMLIMWRLVPETAGRSLEEIERFWKKTESPKQP